MNNNSLSSNLSLLKIVAAFFLLSCVASGQTISAAAATQVSDLLIAKQNFTPAQRKMDSSLIFGAQLARGALAGKSFASAVQVPPVDAGGLTTVDIRGTVADIAAQVAALGGRVISQSPAYGTLRAALPLQSIETLANSPSVVTIGAKEKAIFSVGALTSQGYISHTADAVVAGLGITGAGVKVGVLSDSASAASVTALIASGDLPANTVVLTGQDGATSTTTDEGTAMMEIIHDLAPGAQLFFATANTGVSQFATNILALAAQGCSIIVDDVTYLNESPFQDGPIAQAVNTFVAGGGLYFSAAANGGNLTSGTSGTWEGDFNDGGAVGSPEGGRIHNFGTLTYDSLASPGGPIFLKWSDPLGASNNDYDLFVFDSTGSTLKGFSANAQNGTQDPVEAVGGTDCGTPTASGYCPAAGDRIVVIRWSGSPGQSVRALNLETNGGVLSARTTGATYGHNAGGNTITVAATSWNSARIGTKAFTGLANSVEVFSSDGPRKMFYNANGTAITPGNVLFGTNGGTTLLKPDITAADGVATKTPTFFPFYGTSAAAPHAAAIAALVKSAKPSLTNIQIRNILLNTALDNMAPGWDRDGGYGVVMALTAVQTALQ